MNWKKSVLFLAVYLAVLALLLYFSNWQVVISQIQKISVLQIAMATGIFLAILAVNAANLFVLYYDAPKGSEKRFFKAFIQSWIVSHFLPSKIGDYSLALFMRKEKKMGKTSALVTVDKAVSIAANALLLLLISLFLFTGIDSTTLTTAIAIIVLAILSAVLLWFWKPNWRLKYASFISDFFEEAAFLIKKAPQRIALNFFLTLVRIGLQALLLLIIFRAIGADISFATALFLRILEHFLGILAFTPNAIGIREPVLAVAATRLGILYEHAIAGILVLQALEWAMVAFFGGVLLLLRKPKKKRFQFNTNQPA